MITVIGLIALAGALVVLWRHRWQGSRLTVVGMLLGGIGLATGGGMVAQWLRTGGAWLGGLAETGTTQALGVGLPALVVVVMAMWVGVDLKDSAIHRATPWIAVALPTMVLVLGGAAAGADLLSSVGVTAA